MAALVEPTVELFAATNAKVHAVCVHPSGRLVAATDELANTFVWELESQRLVGVLSLIKAAETERTKLQSQFVTGQLQREYVPGAIVKPGAIVGLDFVSSPGRADGLLIATQQHAVIWWWQAGACTHIYLSDLVTKLLSAAVPVMGSDLLAFGCADGGLRLWNIVTGQLTRNLSPHSKAINVLLSATRGGLVSCGADGMVISWIAELGQIVKNNATAHTTAIVAASVHRGQLVTVGADKVAATWELPQLAEVKRASVNVKPNAAAAVSEGRFLICGKEDKIHVFPPTGGAQPIDPGKLLGRKVKLYDMAHMDDAQRVLVGTNKGLLILHFGIGVVGHAWTTAPSAVLVPGMRGVLAADGSGRELELRAAVPKCAPQTLVRATADGKGIACVHPSGVCALWNANKQTATELTGNAVDAAWSSPAGGSPLRLALAQKDKVSIFSVDSASGSASPETQLTFPGVARLTGGFVLLAHSQSGQARVLTWNGIDLCGSTPMEGTLASSVCVSDSLFAVAFATCVRVFHVNASARSMEVLCTAPVPSVRSMGWFGRVLLLSDGHRVSLCFTNAQLPVTMHVAAVGESVPYLSDSAAPEPTLPLPSAVWAVHGIVNGRIVLSNPKGEVRSVELRSFFLRAMLLAASGRVPDALKWLPKLHPDNQSSLVQYCAAQDAAQTLGSPLVEQLPSAVRAWMCVYAGAWSEVVRHAERCAPAVAREVLVAAVQTAAVSGHARAAVDIVLPALHRLDADAVVDVLRRTHAHIPLNSVPPSWIFHEHAGSIAST